MIYNLNRCPICGSIKLKQNSIKKNGVDEIIIYKCLSCDSIVSNNDYFNDSNVLSATNIFNDNLKSIIEITSDFKDTSLAGTAVLIKNNYALTNAHILMNKEEVANNIYGNFYKDNKSFELEIVSIDEDLDIALLSFKNINYKPIVINDITVNTGETIYAIGNAIGQGLSIVEGIISDSKRSINGIEMMMHTAPVNHGNSGGPLFNSKGELVGMVSSTRKDATSMSYAIPNKILIDFMDN